MNAYAKHPASAPSAAETRALVAKQTAEATRDAALKLWQARVNQFAEQIAADMKALDVEWSGFHRGQARNKSCIAELGECVMDCLDNAFDIPHPEDAARDAEEPVGVPEWED